MAARRWVSSFVVGLLCFFLAQPASAIPIQFSMSGAVTGATAPGLNLEDPFILEFKYDTPVTDLDPAADDGLFVPTIYDFLLEAGPYSYSSVGGGSISTTNDEAVGGGFYSDEIRLSIGGDSTLSNGLLLADISGFFGISFLTVPGGPLSSAALPEDLILTSVFGTSAAFRLLDFESFEFFNNELRVEAASLSPVPVPEPATLLLFGTGLAGMWRVRSRNKKRPDA